MLSAVASNDRSIIALSSVAIIRRENAADLQDGVGDQ